MKYYSFFKMRRSRKISNCQILKDGNSSTTIYFIRPLFQHAVVSGPWEITASLAAVTAEITTFVYLVLSMV